MGGVLRGYGWCRDGICEGLDMYRKATDTLDGSTEVHSIHPSIVLSSSRLASQATSKPSSLHPYFFPYISHPTSSNFWIFPMTSSSNFSAYCANSFVNLGRLPERIRTARRAALVELLIATVATGIPRCSEDSHQ
jgi:hypothetical protein